MKQTFLLALTAVVGLSGCGEKVEESNEVTLSAPQTEKAVDLVKLSPEKIPDGKWLYSPLFCKGELPITGPYDFTVNQNSITYLGITEKGTWYESKNSELAAAINQFIKENNECLKLDSRNIELIEFKSNTSEYILATAQNKVVLRYRNGLVELIRPFDIEEIKRLKIVDNSEASEI